MKCVPSAHYLLWFIVVLTSLGSCGGGGSSDSGVLLEGTLTESGVADHHYSLPVKHADGQRIEGVDICALGQCSRTDAQGQWGLVVPDSFTGGPLEVTSKGHGIDAATIVEIPPGAREVFLDLQHVEAAGRVVALHVTVDGETFHHETEGREHE